MESQDTKQIQAGEAPLGQSFEVSNKESPGQSRTSVRFPNKEQIVPVRENFIKPDAQNTQQKSTQEVKAANFLSMAERLDSLSFG